MAALRTVRKSLMSQPFSEAYLRSRPSGLIATGLPTIVSIGMSLKLSEYA